MSEFDELDELDGEEEELPVEEPEEEQGEAEQEPAEQDGEEAEEEEPDEYVIDIPEPAKESPGIRALREKMKEQERELRELRAKVAPQPQQEELPPKPELWDEGIDGVHAVYDAALIEWAEKKKEFEARKAKQEEAIKAREEAFARKLQSFEEGKKRLAAPDLDEAEAFIRETLDVYQMAFVIEGAKDPARLFYTLAKYPEKARKLAAMPIAEFAREAFEMERKIKQGGKPAPERMVIGNANGSAIDNTLERLRKEAEKTGDLTKVLEYKRKLKAKAA